MKRGYVIPAVTLSFSCSSVEIAKTLCNTILSEDESNGVLWSEDWKEDNCNNPTGRWRATYFGYTDLPITYYSYYSYSGSYGYSNRIDIYLDLNEGSNAILSVQQTFSYYDYSDVFSQEYAGSWSIEESNIDIYINDNYVRFDMDCTQDGVYLECILQDSYIGEVARFERAN